MPGAANSKNSRQTRHFPVYRAEPLFQLTGGKPAPITVSGGARGFAPPAVDRHSQITTGAGDGFTSLESFRTLIGKLGSWLRLFRLRHDWPHERRGYEDSSHFTARKLQG